MSMTDPGPLGAAAGTRPRRQRRLSSSGRFGASGGLYPEELLGGSDLLVQKVDFGTLPSLPPAFSRPLSSNPRTFSGQQTMRLRSASGSPGFGTSERPLSPGRTISSPSKESQRGSSSGQNWRQSPGTPGGYSNSVAATMRLGGVPPYGTPGIDPFLRIVSLTQWLLEHNLMHPALSQSPADAGQGSTGGVEWWTHFDVTGHGTARPTQGRPQTNATDRTVPDRAFMDRLREMANDRGLALDDVAHDLQIFRLTLHDRKARTRLMDLFGPELLGLLRKPRTEPQWVPPTRAAAETVPDAPKGGTKPSGGYDFDFDSGGGGGGRDPVAEAEAEKEKKKRLAGTRRTSDLPPPAASSGGGGGGPAEKGPEKAGGWGDQTGPGWGDKAAEDTEATEVTDTREDQAGLDLPEDDAAKAKAAAAAAEAEAAAAAAKAAADEAAEKEKRRAAAKAAGEESERARRNQSGGFGAGGDPLDASLSKKVRIEEGASEPGGLFRVKDVAGGAAPEGKSLLPAAAPERGSLSSSGVEGNEEEEGSEAGAPSGGRPSPQARQRPGPRWLAEEFRIAIKEAWQRLEASAAERAAGRKSSIFSQGPDISAFVDGSDIDVAAVGSTQEPLERGLTSAGLASRDLVEDLLGFEAESPTGPGKPAASSPGRQLEVASEGTGSGESAQEEEAAQVDEVGAGGPSSSEEDLALDGLHDGGAAEALGETSQKLQRRRYGRRLQARANASLSRNRARQCWLQRVESCRRSLGSLTALGAFAERGGIGLGSQDGGLR